MTDSNRGFTPLIVFPHPLTQEQVTAVRAAWDARTPGDLIVLEEGARLDWIDEHPRLVVSQSLRPYGSPLPYTVMAILSFILSLVALIVASGAVR